MHFWTKVLIRILKPVNCGPPPIITTASGDKPTRIYWLFWNFWTLFQSFSGSAVFWIWRTISSAVWSKSSGAHLWSSQQHQESILCWSTTHPKFIGHFSRIFCSSEVGFLISLVVYCFGALVFINWSLNLGSVTDWSRPWSAWKGKSIPRHPSDLIFHQVINRAPVFPSEPENRVNWPFFFVEKRSTEIKTNRHLRWFICWLLWPLW